MRARSRVRYPTISLDAHVVFTPDLPFLSFPGEFPASLTNSCPKPYSVKRDMFALYSLVDQGIKFARGPCGRAPSKAKTRRFTRQTVR